MKASRYDSSYYSSRPTGREDHPGKPQGQLTAPNSHIPQGNSTPTWIVILGIGTLIVALSCAMVFLFVAFP